MGYKSNCQYKDKSNATDHLLAASELASRVANGYRLGLLHKLSPNLGKSDVCTFQCSSSLSDSVFPISAKLAYSLVRPFILPGSCSELAIKRLPELKVIEFDMEKQEIFFHWDENLSGNDLWIAWISEQLGLVYTKLVQSAPNTGYVTFPNGIKGWALALLTTEKPDEVYVLDSVALAGPAPVQITV